MTVAERLRHDWNDDLRSLLANTRKRLVVSSPYVSLRGVDFVLSHLPEAIKLSARVSLLTDLSPLNVAQASTDPSAVLKLAVSLPGARIFHLPRVHAKVYVRDSETAIVTSGNLTAGGLDINYEYGLKVIDAPTAAAIDRDVSDYSRLGALVPVDVLSTYSERTSELRDLYKAQERALRRTDLRLRRELAAAADELARVRLAGGPMHTVFAATILYLLSRHGPMPTTSLHPRIEGMHPDLCDNSVDRVIEGKRFGKKWKHAVRTAQQQLKKRGLIKLDGDNWTLSGQNLALPGEIE
jgi:hypothetical protein